MLSRLHAAALTSVTADTPRVCSHLLRAMIYMIQDQSDVIGCNLKALDLRIS